MPHKDPREFKRYHAEYRSYKRSVAKRTYTNNGGEWKCAFCGVTWEDGFQLDIHHKDQDHTNNEFNNLVCLCSQCHNELHTKWYKHVIPSLITGMIREKTIDWRDGHVID